MKRPRATPAGSLLALTAFSSALGSAALAQAPPKAVGTEAPKPAAAARPEDARADAPRPEPERLDLAATAAPLWRERAAARVGPVRKRVLALYYTWYGTPQGSGKWLHQDAVEPLKRRIGSHVRYPASGPYDSADPAVIERHLRQAKAAGIDTLVCSWWGKEDATDKALRALLPLAAKRGVEVCVLWERLSRPDDVQSAAEELGYLAETFGKQPAYLKEGGKPVVFLFAGAGGALSPDGWALALAAVARRHAPGVLALADAGPQPRLADLLLWDGLYSLGHTARMAGRDPEASALLQQEAFRAPVLLSRGAGRISVVTLAPGYDDRKLLPDGARRGGTLVDRQEGRLWSGLWEQALRDAPDWVLVNSFNQWHNGTEIEPSVELGDRYLTLTASYASRFTGRPVAAAESSPAKGEKTPAAAGKTVTPVGRTRPSTPRTPPAGKK